MTDEMFSLYVSYDCDVNYRLYKQALTFKELDDVCADLDEKMLRWYILEDQDRRLVSVSRIHREIISTL